MEVALSSRTLQNDIHNRGGDAKSLRLQHQSEEGKAYIEGNVSLEIEKPRIEEIFGKEERTEDISASATIGKEISARKTRIEEIEKKTEI